MTPEDPHCLTIFLPSLVSLPCTNITLYTDSPHFFCFLATYLQAYHSLHSTVTLFIPCIQVPAWLQAEGCLFCVFCHVVVTQLILFSCVRLPRMFCHFFPQLWSHNHSPTSCLADAGGRIPRFGTTLPSQKWSHYYSQIYLSG